MHAPLWPRQRCSQQPRHGRSLDVHQQGNGEGDWCIHTTENSSLDVHQHGNGERDWCIHTTEYFSAVKKNEIIHAAACMALEIIILRQIKTNMIWYHSAVESKKVIQTNFFTEQKQTHRLQKQTSLPKEEGRGRINNKRVYQRRRGGEG